MVNILQMASKGKGHIPPKDNSHSRISSAPSIDAEGFTMVTPKQFFKRGGHIGSSSSSKHKKSSNKEKQQISTPNDKETLAQIVAKNENDEYISKNYPVHICYIEQEDYHLLDNPWAIRAKYLNPFQSRIQSGKPRIYYENILDQTDSMDIHHTRENAKDNNSPIYYSKCIIKKIIKPGNWGLDLSASKAMIINKVSQNFNYWDYHQGFSEVFMYQNQKLKHSWFFKLCSRIITSGGFPVWFYDWWLTYGPIIEILPSNILDAYQRWEKWHPQIRGKNDLPYNYNMVLFFIEFGIPWIWRWDLSIKKDGFINAHSLTRNYWVRWWSKTDIKELDIMINGKADEYFSQYQLNSKEINTFMSQSSLNPFEILRNQIRKSYPNISEAELMTKCMEYFQSQFISFNKEEDSSMGSIKDSDNEVLAGEGQEIEDEDLLSEDLEINEGQLAKFMASLEDMTKRQ